MTIRQLALILPVVIPLLVALASYALGWSRPARWLGLASPLALALGAIATYSGPSIHMLGSIIYADAMTAFMLFTISAVSLLATVASWSYLKLGTSGDQASVHKARQYLVLLQIFLAAMSGAIISDNLGLIWVAIEATTISTAFLVAHKGTSKALEAAWKYVIICSFGITLAFFGTVLLYYSATHAGLTSAQALDIHYLISAAPKMHNGATRLALGLLLLGYGAKVGLVPFHTWLADAHSQAPAPISALMSGVLLSVSLGILLRIKTVADLSVGSALFQKGLLIMGLATIVVAALLLIEQRDFKRLFAYSSLENMGVIAVAASIGTRTAIFALLLQVFAHGIAKSTAFIASGQIQDRIGSTAIADVSDLARQSPRVAFALGLATVALLGFPPFAIFSAEATIGYSLGASGGIVILLLAAVALLIGFGSIFRHVSAMLFSKGPSATSRFAISKLESMTLALGIAISLYVGLFAQPLMTVIEQAGSALGAIR